MVSVLVGCTLLLGITGLGTTGLLFLSALHAQREANVWRVNSLPSVERLSGCRTALRMLDGSLDSALLDMMAGRPFDASAPAAWKERLNQQWTSYRKLPLDPGEPQLQARAEQRFSAVRAVLGRLLPALEQGRAQAAHTIENGDWRRVSDGLDDAFFDLILLDVENLDESSGRSAQTWRRASLGGGMLGLFSVALAAFATSVAARAVRRRLQLQEERATELEAFSARVAHDLLSPLSALGVALQQARNLAHDARVDAVVQRGLSSLGRVRPITEALLDFARSGGMAEPGAVTQVEPTLGPLFEELHPQAKERGIELALEPFPPCEVRCAKGVLLVLMSNLVRNAIKYMGESRERNIRVRVSPETGRVRFEVEDTGPGLRAGVEGVIFKPFMRLQTQSEPGLGLGLATVKRLVEAHGGQVGVRSTEGKGSLFWFELPGAAG
jgi:signal transduction histidine kinase